MDAYSGLEIHKAIYDFYILAQGIPSSINPTRSLLKYRFNVINRWRRTLLRDIEFCCACELRHINDGVANPRNGQTWEEWFHFHFGKVGDLWYQKYLSLATQEKGIPHYNGTGLDLQHLEDMTAILEGNKGNSLNRMQSYVASKMAEAAYGLSLIEVSERAFNSQTVEWDSSFGGAKWQKIAQCIFKLWNAKDLNTIIGCIDEAFALHHNTNVVFTKNNIWGKGGFNWIMKALDRKWAALSPDSLLGLCSGDLLELVLKAGKVVDTVIPLQAYQFVKKIQPGTTVILADGTEAKIRKCWVNGILSSLRVVSDSFKVIKAFKGNAIKYRVYSLAEILKSVQAVKEVGTVQKAIVEEDEPKIPVSTVLTKAIAVFAGIHKKLVKIVPDLFNLSVGGIYQQNGVIRFQVKGGSPLRFYFSLSETESLIGMYVGKTKENALCDADQYKIYKFKETPKGMKFDGNPVEDVKAVIAVHTGVLL